MINSHLLKLPMSQINFHGLKDVWAIKVLQENKKFSIIQSDLEFPARNYVYILTFDYSLSLVSIQTKMDFELSRLHFK